MQDERYRVCMNRTHAEAYRHFFGKGWRFHEQTWNRAFQLRVMQALALIRRKPD